MQDDSPEIAAFGRWSSNISAQFIAAGVTPLASPRFDGGQACWLEGRSAEGGRIVIVREGSGVLTPAPFNVRSRVHEYGGGAYTVDDGEFFFSNFSDNRVYRHRPGHRTGEEPTALTADSRCRHADFEVDRPRQRLYAVQEDHRGGDHEPVNRLVAIDLRRGGQEESPTEGRTLAEGHDFYSAPRLSPDGRWLAWLCWNHPRMPWDGTELWIAELDTQGQTHHARRLAGGPSESLVQPLWSPQGVLHVVSDRSGWWNIHRVTLDAGSDGQSDSQSGDHADRLEPIGPMAMEFGRPAWVFGQSLYGFDAQGRLYAAAIDRGISMPMRWVEPGAGSPQGSWQPMSTPYTDIQELRVGPDSLLLHAGSPTQPDQILRLPLDHDRPSAQARVLARSVEVELAPSEVSIAEPIEFDSGSHRAHAFFYRPTHPRFQAPAKDKPPLIVTSHGGPTSMASSSLRLPIQFWTSRGFAVVDVNYGGSSGFGRAYRRLLDGQWGVVDVADCVAAARHLIARGEVDAERVAIRGSSASGLTTLCAVAFHDLFKAGASYYGVSDLAALDADTHKFESRYTQTLVAPIERRADVYARRSPMVHVDRINCPMIFFQGEDDRVVPPAQSEAMVAALRARGIDVTYQLFAGEGHGFRQSATIERTLQAELEFYLRVFGIARDASGGAGS